MRSEPGASALESRIRRVVARLNETNAGLEAFDDHAAREGNADLEGASWSVRITEDIVHWELITDGRVAARVFAPFRGGHWRYEVFAEHARPPATDALVPRPLSEALRRLAVHSPAARLEASPLATRARAAQERLDRAEDAADAALASFGQAPAPERAERRVALDAALRDEAAAREARVAADADAEADDAGTEREDERPRRTSTP